ncbi:Uncharacterised protein [Providencia stuartii]|nr:Uncharacterised protein [Providencia stuartii]
MQVLKHLVVLRKVGMAVTADQRAGYAVKMAMGQLVDNIRDKKAITGADYPPTIISKDNLDQAERIGELK